MTQQETGRHTGGMFDSLDMSQMVEFYLAAIDSKNPVIYEAARGELQRRLEYQYDRATGLTPDDCKYGVAESVRKSAHRGYVYVTYNGVEHGLSRQTFGPVDFDPAKGTSVINTGTDAEPCFMKLEYPDQWDMNAAMKEMLASFLPK